MPFASVTLPPATVIVLVPLIVTVPLVRVALPLAVSIVKFVRPIKVVPLMV